MNNDVFEDIFLTFVTFIWYVNVCNLISLRKCYSMMEWSFSVKFSFSKAAFLLSSCLRRYILFMLFLISNEVCVSYIQRTLLFVKIIYFSILKKCKKKNLLSQYSIRYYIDENIKFTSRKVILIGLLYYKIFLRYLWPWLIIDSDCYNKFSWIISKK